MHSATSRALWAQSLSLLNAILVSAGLLATGKQLTLVEDRLEAALSAIHDGRLPNNDGKLSVQAMLELAKNLAPSDSWNNGTNRASRTAARTCKKYLHLAASNRR